MNDPASIAESYIAIWNETDAGRRRELIARDWTAEMTYVDPLASCDGAEVVDQMIAGVQEQFPGHRFTLSGQPDGYGDRVRFSWSLAANGAPPVVRGTDFGVVSDDGRLKSVTGFLDQVPDGN